MGGLSRAEVAYLGESLGAIDVQLERLANRIDRLEGICADLARANVALAERVKQLQAHRTV